MSGNYCASCGHQLAGGARFCANCGRPVPAAATSAPGTRWRKLVLWLGGALVAAFAVLIAMGWLAYERMNQYIDTTMREHDARYERVCESEIPAYKAGAVDTETREIRETLTQGAWIVSYGNDTPLDDQLEKVADEQADDRQSFLMYACATVFGHGLNQEWDEPTQIARWKEVRAK